MFFSSKSKEKAITVAKSYAASVGIGWTQVLSTTVHRDFFWTTPWYTFKVDTGDGTAEVCVYGTSSLERLEYYPNDPKKFILPLWLACPGVNSVSMYWRMSHGEEYKHRWHNWYRERTAREKAEYKKHYPPPSDEDLGWGGFYELVADVPSDGSMGAMILGQV